MEDQLAALPDNLRERTLRFLDDCETVPGLAEQVRAHVAHMLDAHPEENSPWLKKYLDDVEAALAKRNEQVADAMLAYRKRVDALNVLLLRHMVRAHRNLMDDLDPKDAGEYVMVPDLYWRASVAMTKHGVTTLGELVTFLRSHPTADEHGMGPETYAALAEKMRERYEYELPPYVPHSKKPGAARNYARKEKKG